jgi:selenocysteine lyase/cysteine desulfurase
VALAAAMRALEALGLDEIEAHEAALTRYTLRRLAEVPGLRLYGPRDPDRTDRLGVFTFNLDRRPHALVAAILGYEHAIGVRNGCFCAHPLLYRLLGLSSEQIDGFRARMRAHRHEGVPGAVRASLGIYNTQAEVDALITGLRAIAAGEYSGTYNEDPTTGDFQPAGARDYVPDVFDLEMYMPVARSLEHDHAH